MKKHSAFALAALLILLTGCSSGPEKVAGGSSDHGNAMTGVILSPASLPAAGVKVQAFNYNHIPVPGASNDSLSTTFTNNQGAFTLALPRPGIYNLVASDTISILTLYLPQAEVSAESTLDLGTHRLEKAGCFSSAIYDSLSGIKIDSAFVYIAGTPFFAQTDANGRFAFNLPSGDYKLTAQISHQAVFPDTLITGPLIIISADSATLLPQILLPLSTRAETLSYAGYTLTFQDEFNGTSLDWKSSTNPSGAWYTYFRAFNIRTLAGNNEQQVYVDPEFYGTDTVPLGINPFNVTGGVLTITGDTAPSALRPFIWNYNYTSGMLSSESTFCQLYGLFEIRCKTPKGIGLRPSFWLLPCDASFPPDIAILDIFGNHPGTVNQAAVMPGDTTSVDYVYSGVDPADGFHTYAVEWFPDQLVWYVDGKQTHRAYRTINLPMYMVVNLAMGGYREGTPDSATMIPAKLEIDYIRSYQKP